MEAVFIALTEQLNSAVFFLLLVMVLAIWVAVKMSAIATDWKHMTEEIRAIKLDQTAIRREFGADIRAIRADMDQMNWRLSLLFKNYEKDVPAATAAKNSPYRLTEIGQSMRKTLQADKILDDNAVRLREYMTEKNPTTAYDLEERAMDAAERLMPQLMPQPQLDIAKNLAYQYDLPLPLVFRLFGVLLRDRMLKELNIKEPPKITPPPPQKT